MPVSVLLLLLLLLTTSEQWVLVVAESAIQHDMLYKSMHDVLLLTSNQDNSGRHLFLDQKFNINLFFITVVVKNESHCNLLVP